MMKERQVSIAGRVTNKREMGANLRFYDVKGEKSKIQVMVNAGNHESEEEFKELHHKIHRGDIIGVRGFPCRTKAGELSIAPGVVMLLSPCLH